MTALSMPFQSRLASADSRPVGAVVCTVRRRFLMLCLLMTAGALAWHVVEASPALAVPLPAGYVQCGTENGTNNCPSGTIAYGAQNE